VLGYALRRLLAAIPLLWLVWSLTFLVGRLVPGDPVDLYQGPGVSRQSLERLREAYGLDDPLPVQYVRQLTSTLRGDLALSTAQGRPVRAIIPAAVGPTLLLASLALLFQFVLGTFLGVASAAAQGRPLDATITTLSLFFYSMPIFWLAVELILVFSYRLGWLPPSHMHGIGAADAGFLAWMLDLLRHLTLPLLTLGLSGTAATIRHVRSSMLEVAGTDFVRSARSRGLPEWRVVWRHGLRNALLPLVTLMGLSLPFLLSGAVLVEVIFSWPGLGQVAFNAIRARDFPVVQATTLMTAALVVAGSLLADLAAAVADPRIRLTEDEG
jgi:peptide/nickel transport system permease protein